MLTRVHVYQLKVGMYVSELDIPWEQSPFLLQGFDIKSPADIKAVQDVCEYVMIDTARQKAIHGDLAETSQKKMQQAFNKSAETYGKASDLVKDIMDDIRFGNQFSTQSAKATVEDCVNQVLEAPSAMMFFSQLKNQHEYTSQHSLNVCVLSIMLAKHLGYPMDQLVEVGMCGLLHDMGKMKVPVDILDKPGRLTEEETAIMRQHTTFGRDLLMSGRDIPAWCVDVAYTHHEQMNGQGYPRGLNGAGISTYARIISIADMYDAMTSDKSYQRGRLHLQAISMLTQMRNSHLDESLVMKFIDCIGVYPVGNAVEFRNGEVAVVLENNTKQKTKPKVLMLMNAHKEKISPYVLNLADNPVDANNQPYAVLKVLHKGDYGLDLHELNQENGIQAFL